MSESELQTYQLQLQQVEAALTADPENAAELNKLKADLEQVIGLTKQLIQQQVRGASGGDDDEAAASTSSSQAAAGTKRKFNEDLTPVKHWQVRHKTAFIWPLQP